MKVKVKTEDLIGPVLDRVVAHCLEWSRPFPLFIDGLPSRRGAFSTDWAKGGPIIEQKKIYLAKSVLGGWTGSIFIKDKGYNCIMHSAPTPLIAAMRAYVASKMGDEIEVPEEEIK